MSQKRRAYICSNRNPNVSNLKREWLHKIVEEEVEKEELEQDLELIMECEKCLEELSPFLELSEEEYTDGLCKIYARAAVEKKTTKKRLVKKFQSNEISTVIVTT